MKLADIIASGLRGFVRGAGREIILQNFYHSYYEMDVFRLMPSGLIVEYEIKISRSDYFNDFKKNHRIYTSANYDKPDIVLKHDWIKTGAGPNRFFFVTPAGLLKVEEVPDYAGLIEFHEEDEQRWFSMVKNSGLIHKNKFADGRYKELAELLSFREANLRNSAGFYKYELNAEKKKVKNLMQIIKDAKIRMNLQRIIRLSISSSQRNRLFMNSCNVKKSSAPHYMGSSWLMYMESQEHG